MTAGSFTVPEMMGIFEIILNEAEDLSGVAKHFAQGLPCNLHRILMDYSLTVFGQQCYNARIMSMILYGKRMETDEVNSLE